MAPTLGMHVHGTPLASALGTTALQTATHPDHAQVAMWVAHAIAAVITVLALGRGEQLLRALSELTGWNLVARLLIGQALPVRPALPASPHSVPTLRSRFALTVVLRRGPPLAA